MENLRRILEKTFVADLEHHATIGSTNDRAIQRAAAERVKLPLLVIADRQTAGRGRGSNRWWTGPDSIAFSLLIGPELCAHTGEQACRTPPGGTYRSGLISLAAGVAVVEAMAPLAPGHAIGIHWPNDVVLGGRKLAGILVEVLPDGKCVIGIGINTNNTAANAPEEVRSRVATLFDATGRKHDPAEVLICVLRPLERWISELGISPDSVARRAHELCLQRGKRLEIEQGAQRTVGRCLGIAADGALLLEIDGKPQTIYSGIVATVEPDPLHCRH